MPRNVLRRLRRLLRRDPRRLAFCAIALSALLAGCGGSRAIVRSECPEPSPEEARDLSEWLLEDERPAQVWAARVVGHIYPDDLDEIRGGSDDEGAWGWMMPPWWSGRIGNETSADTE